MSKLVLGIDIGITSVGWGILDIETNKIVDKGVRIFPERTAADNLKRREKRGSRRLSRRRNQRILDMKDLLIKENLIDDDFQYLTNPYHIRVKGLKEKLNKNEFGTAILHITKRRGSILDTIEDDEAKQKDSISTKGILSANERLMKQKGFHVSELQLERLNSGESIRGINNNFKTENYVDETLAILNMQNIDEDVAKKIINLVKRKREYYDGPGSEKSPTPYGQWFYDEDGKLINVSMIEKMRGKCTIFKSEFTAPKMSYSADLFNFLNDLNNLTVDGESITYEQKQEIIENYINKKGYISPENLIKYLGVDEYSISGFRIDKNEKPLLTEFKGYKKILSVVNNKENPLDKEIINNKDHVDRIIEILTRVKGLKERVGEIKSIDPKLFTEEVSLTLANISGVVGYHSLSYKAIKILTKELLTTDENQMQILARSGLLEQSKTKNLAGLKNIPFDDEAILSPVAKRAQNETLKVINAIRKQYGELESIIIEVARDRNSAEEKQKLAKAQKHGEILNKRCEELARGVKLNLKLRHKLRLYEEQNAVCLYSGKPIDLYKLLHDPFAYEIDHIIPISISLDDSMNNKVLVLSDYNRMKGNMTPFQFFKSGKATGWSYEEYKIYVLSLFNSRRNRKVLNLLFEEDINSFSVRKKFIQRNLVDTRYASRSILNTLQNYYTANDIDTKVHTIRGALTDVFRKKAGLSKDRDYYYHHIVDALIIAGIKKQNYLNQLLKYSKSNIDFDEETGEVIKVIEEKDFFGEDYLEYIASLKKLNDSIIYDGTYKISHKVDRKPNRQFTDETIYGVRTVDGIDLRMGRYKDIYGPDGIKLAKDIKDGNHDKILMSKVDPKTYKLLADIVASYENIEKENPFERYKEEHGYIKKVSKKGNGPIIKSVKFYHEKLGNHVDISHKYNTNDNKVVLLQVSPYRTDFYRNNSGLYKFVTIRYANLNEYKNGYFIDEDWYNNELKKKKISKDFEFQFSLNRNEYVEIVKQEKDFRETNLYRFVATNNDDKNVIEVKPIHSHKDANKAQLVISVGSKILSLEKYHVDILGNIYKNKKETLKLKI